jgi:Phosphotransferase enzyme family
MASLRIPSSLEEALDPAWLTEALSGSHPGVEVTNVVPGPKVERVSTNARFTIEGTIPEGLSPHLCVKGYYAPDARASASAGIAEALFYRDIVARTGVRTLTPVVAAVAEDFSDAVLITEDVAHAGATFLDSLSDYSPSQVDESLGQFAQLHASTWDDPDLEATAWLAPRLTSVMRVRGLPEIRGNFDGPIGAGVPKEAAKPEVLMEALAAVPALAAELGPRSVITGDAHVGNVFIDAEGRVNLVDWQVCQLGNWFLDVGYHLGCTLGVEERREHHDRLVDSYLEQLAARGREVELSSDQLRLGLACGLVYGFFLWAITLKVAPPITTAMLERLGTAVADYDALELVLSAAR